MGSDKLNPFFVFRWSLWKRIRHVPSAILGGHQCRNDRKTGRQFPWTDTLCWNIREILALFLRMTPRAPRLLAAFSGESRQAIKAPLECDASWTIKDVIRQWRDGRNLSSHVGQYPTRAALARFRNLPLLANGGLSLMILLTSSLFGQGSLMSTSSVASINNLKNAAYCADTSVSANTITCSTAVGFTGYAAGQAADVLLANTVTGATTINVNTLGAKAVTYNGTNALTSSTGLVAGGTYRLEYDGTRFVLQGVITASSSCPSGASGDVQFYVSAGVCGGSADLNWNGTTLAIAKSLSLGVLAGGQDFQAVTQRSFGLTGTTTVNGSDAFTVTGGALLAQAAVGDLFTLSSNPTFFNQITAVTDNTHFTALNADGDGTSQTITLYPSFYRGINSSGVAIGIDAFGDLNIGEDSFLADNDLVVPLNAHLFGIVDRSSISHLSNFDYGQLIFLASAIDNAPAWGSLSKQISMEFYNESPMGVTNNLRMIDMVFIDKQVDTGSTGKALNLHYNSTTANPSTEFAYLGFDVQSGHPGNMPGTLYGTKFDYTNGAGTATSAHWTNLNSGANQFAFHGAGTAASKFGGDVNSVSYSTATNCADSAGAAACGSAAAGAFVVDAAATSTVVSTTAVTANSEIFVFFDAGLGTRLGITCNSSVPTVYGVTARTAGTSFTLSSTAPAVNPACFNYLIVN